MENTQVKQEAETSTEKFTVFDIAGRKFAIHIKNVKEVIYLPSITHLPNTQSFVRGIFNFRGSIVTVIDLTILFQLDTTPERQFSNLLIVTNKDSNYGLLVEKMNDFIQVDPSRVEIDSSQIPATIKAITSGFYDKSIILIDGEKLFNTQEIVII
jgi:purine-binding chemotaxis protein CheW